MARYITTPRFIALSLLMGCGCASPAHVEPAVTTLPTVIIEAKPTNNGIEMETLDATRLFDRARNHLKNGDCAAAVRDYDRLVNNYPDDALVDPALFNRGLCQDQLGQAAQAEASYRQLVEQFPASANTHDARFRMGGSQESQKKWDAAEQTFDTMLTAPQKLTPVEQIEALTRRGHARMQQDKPASAKYDFENAIRIYRSDGAIEETSPDYYYSMAQFQLAELTHQEMRSIALPPDDTRLAEILEKKCRLLLNSQHRYTRVIKIGHPHWSGAAAYRTGALYHHLWQDMLAAPLPAHLTEEEAQVYREVLQDRIKTLLHKAVRQWKRTISFANRLHLENEWISETKSDLAKIEALLETEDHAESDPHTD